MFLYSYQNKEAVEILLNSKELKITEKERSYTLPVLWKDMNFYIKDAYEYLMLRMDERIKTKREESIVSPIFSWYKMNGKRRPLVKDNEGYKGLYRIEFEIDKHEVLLSDFDLFNYIFSSKYIPNNEEDLEWYNSEGYKSITKEKSYKSFDIMFNVKLKNDTYYQFSSSKITVQATLWKLTLPMVSKIYYIKENGRGKLIYSSCGNKS